MNKTIAVFGDCMLDTYVQVTPTRISPEAPVLICKKGEEYHCPGGAANVAANIQTGFGLDVRLIGVQGTDEIRCKLVRTLDSYKISWKYLAGVVDWQTIEKRRFVDDLGRQILRLDTEIENAKLSAAIENELREYLCEASEETDGLVISDYGKGTCTPDLIKYAIQSFRSREKYVIVNGKPNKLASYVGANLLVYNLSEAAAAWAQFGDYAWNGTDVPSLAGMLRKRINSFPQAASTRKTDVLITCGAEGMILWDMTGFWAQKAIPIKIADVTGAGDTVVATIATLIGESNNTWPMILKEAAIRAAEVVSQHGTSIVKKG